MINAFKLTRAPAAALAAALVTTAAAPVTSAGPFLEPDAQVL